MFCQLNIKQNVTLLILVNIFIFIFSHALTGSLQVKTSTPKKNNNNKNHKKNLNLSLLTSYFRPDRSLLFILLPVWRLWFSCQPIKKIELIHSPRVHNLATIPLTRSQNDPGLKIGESTNERYLVIHCCGFNSAGFEIS